MPILINLVDISPEGFPIDREVQSSEIALSSDDGEISGSLHCSGQVFSPEENRANFHGILTGRVVRECVRCLMHYEEDLSLVLDAEFCQSTPTVSVPATSKNKKKGSRRHDVPIDDEYEKDIDSYPIMDNHIDLLPALREHLILATPLQPLCHESCSGLCQVCGNNLNEGVCECCSPVTVSSSVVSNAHNVLSTKTVKHSSKSL
jgi:uncharacterized protein